MKKLALENNAACIITDRLTRAYLSGADVAEGCMLFAAGAGYYFTDARYYSAAKIKAENAGFIPVLYTGEESVKKVFSESGAAALYADFTRITAADYLEYKTWCADLRDCSGLLSEMRAVKSEEELKLIARACEIAQNAYYAGMEKIKEGMAEKELADVIEKEMLSLGAEGPSFETIVAFGKNAAVPHHETGDTRLKEGCAVLVDMGAKYKGYCSDLTRMAFFGTPGEEFLSAYKAVLAANLTAEDSIRAGMTGREADKTARDVLAAAGYGEYFTHSLGHGVGLEIHEYPALSPKKEQELKEGQVFTVEPGVYIDGAFGIRIEDTVTLSGGKIKRLFTDGKELKTIKRQ